MVGSTNKGFPDILDNRCNMENIFLATFFHLFSSSFDMPQLGTFLRWSQGPVRPALIENACRITSYQACDMLVAVAYISQTRSGPKIPAADQLEGGDFLG